MKNPVKGSLAPMKRREFITLIAGAAASPLGAHAQQRAGRRHRVAQLGPIPPSFFDELDRVGFVKGSNLEIDSRGESAAAVSYVSMAVELAKASPDVLVVVGAEAGRAAQKATQRIPIVVIADDLVGSELVASMPRPEGNTTGVAIFAFQLDAKRLELLHEALPGTRRIAALADRVPIPNMDALKSAAKRLGVEIVPFAARSEEDLIRVIDAMKIEEVEAVNLLASPILASKFQHLIRDRLALRRLPAILQWPEQAEEGGLMAYGPRLSAVFEQCARQVARLLRGAHIADVPVEQPTKFELVINLKTAKMLGLEIPPILLSRADSTIE
ncbi:ABC transporter substrate-binding protein [Bradyrhizobium sp. NC92]|uniref:ABC transporter substrate-binding protein n=1 Tax=Bradyrhizobium sp. (strain NC92) TaxID=55395 RepID=UPI0021AAE268|nr:ABC transporter substrate-binding protein [Bradyrhizobium sp. NC92]UWU69479.1 ABC transporter substrate-binding protein [Bradyrhizobium sp. NC92]